MWMIICKRIFGLGFWISAISFASQAFAIIQNQSSANVSLMMFILFTGLNINSIFYGIKIAKDSWITWGAFISLLTCILVLVLMWIY